MKNYFIHIVNHTQQAQSQLLGLENFTKAGFVNLQSISLGGRGKRRLHKFLSRVCVCGGCVTKKRQQETACSVCDNKTQQEIEMVDKHHDSLLSTLTFNSVHYQSMPTKEPSSSNRSMKTWKNSVEARK